MSLRKIIRNTAVILGIAGLAFSTRMELKYQDNISELLKTRKARDYTELTEKQDFVNYINNERKKFYAAGGIGASALLYLLFGTSNSSRKKEKDE